MWLVVKQMLLGHKYFMHVTDLFTLAFEWEGLEDNATIFGPQADAIAHRTIAKRQEPHANIYIDVPKSKSSTTIEKA